MAKSSNQSIDRLMYSIAGKNLTYRKGQRQQTYLALAFNRNKVIKTGCAALKLGKQFCSLNGDYDHAPRHWATDNSENFFSLNDKRLARIYPTTIEWVKPC